MSCNLAFINSCVLLTIRNFHYQFGKPMSLCIFIANIILTVFLNLLGSSKVIMKRWLINHCKGIQDTWRNWACAVSWESACNSEF